MLCECMEIIVSVFLVVIVINLFIVFFRINYFEIFIENLKKKIIELFRKLFLFVL